MQLLVIGLRNLVLRGAPVDGRYDQAPVNLLDEWHCSSVALLQREGLEDV